jgi:hydrogenase maturation protease
MNRALVDPIANAVLYEGYILYPYRPSAKNHQRWTFGSLYPEPYCRDRTGDASGQQTECLVLGSPVTTIEAVVRFLHLTARNVGAIDPPLARWPEGEEPPSRPVEALRIGDVVVHAWQEAEEREASLGELTLGDLTSRPRYSSFSFSGGRRLEPLLGPGGEAVGVLIREQREIEAAVELSAVEVERGLYRLTLRVSNRTSPDGARLIGRDEALLHGLASTHAILGATGGEFVSLMDPPGAFREAASACRNVGAWPVLVGEEGRADMMLSSPIILYDYPRVASESPGDYFDATEMDEMLTLRIMTLTDEEKGAMASVDGRAGALLARTEALARDEMLNLHGRVRGFRTLPEGGQA